MRCTLNGTVLSEKKGSKAGFVKGRNLRETNTLSFEIGGGIFFAEVKKNEKGKGGDCFEK